MKSGKTSSGFEFTVSETVIDDMELIDALADVVSGENVLALSTAVRKVLGSDKSRLYDHCRREDGTVPTEAVMNEIQEIIESAGEDGKK